VTMTRHVVINHPIHACGNILGNIFHGETSLCRREQCPPRDGNSRSPLLFCNLLSRDASDVTRLWHNEHAGLMGDHITL